MFDIRRAWPVAAWMILASLPANGQSEFDTWIAKQLIRAETEASIPNRAGIREGLRRSLGTDIPWNWPDLQPKVESTVARKGYRIEQVSAQFWPGVRYSMHVYVPDGASPFPAIILAATDLNHNDTGGDGGRDPLFQQLAGGFARMGILTTAFIPLGKADQPTTYHYNGIGTLVGTSVPQEHVNSARRALDYTAARKDVDPNRLGVTGLSLGGWVTILLAASDDRIVACAPGASNWTYSGVLLPLAWKGLYDTPEGGAPEVLTYGGNYPGLAAAMAPKWMHYLNCGLEGERLQYIPIIDGAAKAAYRVAGVDRRYTSEIFPCPHVYCESMQVDSISWFCERFFGKRPPDGTFLLRKLPEERVRRRRTINSNTRIEELLIRDDSGVYQPVEITEPYDPGWQALQTGNLPGDPGRPALLQIIAARREESRAARLESVKRPASQWLAEMRHCLGWDGLELNRATAQDGNSVVFEPEPGLHVRGRWIGKASDHSGTVRILLGRKEDREAAARFLDPALPVFDLDLRESDTVAKSTMVLLILNRPPIGMWAWDALTAVEALAAQGYQSTELVGAGDAGVVAAALAGMFAGRAVPVRFSGQHLESLDADIVGRQLPKTVFWCHRLLRVSDLPDWVRLLKSKGQWKE